MKIVTMFLIVLNFGFMAMAQEAEAPAASAVAGGKTKKAGMDRSSGCGYGWNIAKDKSLVSSYTRSLINATTSSTSGMTSGTSGCDKHSIVSNEMQKEHYAEINYHNLMIESSQGNGEYVKGFALVMGCDQAQASAFSAAAQKHYNKLFPTTEANPSQLVRSMQDVMQSENVCSQQTI